MSFYVRYYVTDDDELSLAQLEAGLQEFDPAYALPREDEAGELRYGGELFAEVEINHPGESVFDEEIEETIEGVNLAGGENVPRVLDALRETRRTVAFRILWQGREPEKTLTRIDPALVWLMLNREGLLQVDGEGFYEGEELILEME